MAISKTYSAQLIGLNTHILSIEVDLSNGLHSFAIVGLPDKAVEEAKDRVSSAIKNSGYVSPKQKNQKVVVSLAPADIRKEGSGFDLAIAIGYLLASGDLNFDFRDKLFLGELSLEGKIRKINGVLPIIKGVKSMGFKEIFIPKDNVKEASLISGIKIYGVESLNDLIDHLNNKKNCILKPEKLTHIKYKDEIYETDFSLIQGQEIAKRGLLISACGGHNMAMYGPPGTGKTMLAKAFLSILPDLSVEEILEVTSIHSVAKILELPFITRPPFRSPHHTSSYASLVGGGSIPQPGEITLAHRGVLFLDEFPEFEKNVIDSLRQPLEDHTVTISRARGRISFPAKFILIACMNPCPCGYGKGKNCTCSTRELIYYKKKLSGPIIDRIDLWASVSKVEYMKLANPDKKNMTSRDFRKIVERTRNVQISRFKKYNIKNISLNSEMNITDIQKCINIEKSTKDLLSSSAERLGLSGRAYHRTLKLAQTIADIEQKDIVMPEHILEALQYRERG
jgi:magnesium chelatase family protein